MSTLREAAQQALEALEHGHRDYRKQDAAITALRAALAEFQPDWDRIEPLQENLREHMAEIQRLRTQRDALLGALRPFVTIGSGFDMEDVRKGRAAIKKAEENT